MTDTLDTVLQQAVVCAYAVPVGGAVVAAGLSIVQAIVDASRSPGSVGGFSVEAAIADLGRTVADLLSGDHVADQLATIGGWQSDIVHTTQFTEDFARTGPTDPVQQSLLASQIEQDFVADGSYDELFADLRSAKAGSETMVRSLGTYLAACGTYHGLCQAKLAYQARALGIHDTEGAWTSVPSRIRTLLEDSLADALGYASATVARMHDAVRDGEQRAWNAAAASVPVEEHPGVMEALDGRSPDDYFTAFAVELRRVRTEAGLMFASGEMLMPSDVAVFAGYIDAFTALQSRLKAVPLPAQATTTAPVAVAAQVTRTLPVRPPGVARFLVETGPTGGYVDVLADSPVAPGGGLAAQDAGSTNSGLYYRFGGAPVNGIFKALLGRAAQLDDASAALQAAYDVKYGQGAFVADSATTPQDKLTTLLVPVDPGTPPIGDHVLGILYSVGPRLRGRGIEDEAAYQQIYADGFEAVAAWNVARPAAAVTAIRLTLLSTGAYAGTSDAAQLAALRAQAAGLVIRAAVDAMGRHPELAGTTFLINTDDTAGGLERIAYDAAARARGITPVDQGFDVPIH